MRKRPYAIRVTLTGMCQDRVCLDCLGQGILLTGNEYETLLAIANGEDDAILDGQAFDYE